MNDGSGTGVLSGGPFHPADLRALWDFDDLPATAARFTALAAILDADSVRAGELTTQQARVHGLLGEVAAGHRLLDELAGETHAVVRTRIALERGRLLNSSGEAQASIPVFREAINHARDAGRDDLAADALHMLAIADIEHEKHWCERGVAVASASGDPEARRWLGPLHNNHGWALHDAERYDEALDVFRLARDAYGDAGRMEAIQGADWTIARCLRSLGRREEALAIQRRLKAEGLPSPHVDEELAILESGG